MELVKLLAALAAIGVSSVSATGSRVVRNPDKVQARDGLQSPSTLPVPNSPTSQGCFSSGGNMTKVNVQYLASGSCIKACLDSDYWVAGLHGDQCLCGFAYPPSKSRTKEDSDCNYPCPYWKVEACGGLGDGHGGPSYYSIFNTGLNISASFYSPPKSSTGHSSSTTSSSSSQSTSTSDSTTDPAATTTGDASSSATATGDPDKDNNSSGGTNVGAIAGGIVAGVVVIAAAIAGGFFYLRKKRYAEIEEEHRRNAAVNAFISGSQPPSTSGSISMTDSRLDPVMAHRRMSDGSIADNQDYSRRILRVTNA